MEGEIFRTRPDRLWGQHSLLYNEYRVSFIGVKPPGSGAEHPLPPSAEVKERVELFLYSPSGPSRQVVSWTLPKHSSLQTQNNSVRLLFKICHFHHNFTQERPTNILKSKTPKRIPAIQNSGLHFYKCGAFHGQRHRIARKSIYSYLN